MENSLMKALSARFNAFFLIGLAVIYFSIDIHKEKEVPEDTKQLDVVFSKIQVIKGWKGDIDYKLFAEGYQAEFVIYKGTLTAEGRKKLSELKQGASLQILIDGKIFEKVKSVKNWVPVYSLTADKDVLLTTKEFKANQSKFVLRKMLMYLAVGFVTLLSGIKAIPNKFVYAVGIGLFVVALVLRAFNLWVY